MIVQRVAVKNWRNFSSFDVRLQPRMFILGANAVGKSNFLDVFRFLRDIALSEGGGLKKAINDRGGVPRMRSLAARQDSEITIEVDLGGADSTEETWSYSLGIKQEGRGKREPVITKEIVRHRGQKVLDRPNKDDRQDKVRLTQTYLEQLNSNVEFRPIADFFQSVTYLHLVPQLLRHSESLGGQKLAHDPFGQGLLERIATTQKRTLESRLKRIQEGIRVAVPNFEELEFVRDKATGQPHLQARYAHWRPRAGLQREDQFSDGTLRLIGLLWSLLEADSMLLLEEPELSLNDEIVRQLAPLVSRMQRSTKRPIRQVLISTHSYALLDDPGIDGHEVLFLNAEKEATRASVAADDISLHDTLSKGMTVAEAVLPLTYPRQATRLGRLDG